MSDKGNEAAWGGEKDKSETNSEPVGAYKKLGLENGCRGKL